MRITSCPFSRLSWRLLLPHFVAIVLFLTLSYLYFYPLLLGKTVAQTDRDQWQGSAQELENYRKEHDGAQSFWTGSMFSGMPSVMVSLTYDYNVISPIDQVLNFGARPASYLLITMLGFYILLLVLGVKPWLAIVGAVGYGFSTYFFIIVGAGHNAKLHAISYMAPMVAGVVLAYKQRYWAGAGLFALSFALSLATGHVQITYYTFFIILAIVIWRFVELFRVRALRTFFVGSAFLAIAALLGVGANFNRLYQTYDYGKSSIRGQSYLKETELQKSEGLDKSYATQWSYGKLESFNMLVPNLYGGASVYELDEQSQVARFLQEVRIPREQERAILKQLPLYWGDQPMTSGPVYLGAVVLFLFVFSFFLLRGAVRWALLGVSVVALMLSWGHNFQWFTDLFFAIFPGYNKFRSVSMILVICEFCIPLLAILGLSDLLQGKVDKSRALRAFYIAVISLLGLLLVFLFASIWFSFSSPQDAVYVQSGYPEQLIVALRKDRASLLLTDIFRSAGYILVASGVLFFYLKGKVRSLVYVVLTGLLIITDLWFVNKRYDGVHYVAKSHNQQPFPKTVADQRILQDHGYFRVFNASVSPFNDASTSYYHKSLGGYHGVKLRRYQDLIDRYGGKPAMLNLMNAKYIIFPDRERGVRVEENVERFGEAWFVDRLVYVPTADAELDSIGNPAIDRVGYLQESEAHIAAHFAGRDSSDRIALVSYAPNRLEYRVSANGARFAVFSEVYYPKGWVARIDGVEAPIHRVDYLLRGLYVPEGAKEIVFSFSLPSYYIGRRIDLIFGVFIVIILVFSVIKSFRRQLASSPQAVEA